jgi:hypothetical protein
VTTEGRTRMTRARRKQEKAAAMWAEDDWRKYARCYLCRKRFVANNYPDRKVRVNSTKIAGKITCPWCRSRDAKFMMQLVLIAEKAANGACELLGEPETCKCLTHVSRRILQAHQDAPTIR